MIAGTLRIAMAQLDLLVGDIDGNAARVIEAARRARDELRAHAIVFPELTLTGYPPEDLLLRPGLRRRVARALERVAAEARGIDVVLGYPRAADDGLRNSASLLREGRVVATYDKQELPNYSVFDEVRHFRPGSGPCVTEIAGVPVGITICEDIWKPGHVRAAAQAGARLMLNLNASPFHAEKHLEREAVARARAAESGIPLLYVNLVGGQDELVFDGGSFVADAAGALTQRAPAFDEGLYLAEFRLPAVVPVPVEIATPESVEASVYRALVTGVRDYVEKNGFPGAVVGLSGGVDSALTLAIAVDALGAGRVQAVMMPSRFTASMSLEDAEAEAHALGVAYSVVPIEPVFESLLASLSPEFGDAPADVTEENLQARARGMILMAISNKKNRIVLTTGNKSEVSVGYATLYGDMVGGFAPLKDVFKMLVYRLCRYRNSLGTVIPERVLTRAPTAELRADQKDEDSLPPYPVLDAILERYVEQDRSVEEIVADGFEAETVRRVARLVDRNEYKRRQAAPGVRITRRAFGRDRRYPITSGYGLGDPGEG